MVCIYCEQKMEYIDELQICHVCYCRTRDVKDELALARLVGVLEE